MSDQPIASMSYGIPDEVRHRILLVLEDAVVNASGHFELFLSQIERLLLKRYGFLAQSGYVAARRSQNPVVEYFACCDEGQFLYLLEVCFEQEVLCGKQNIVDEINKIFRQTGIGYHFTPFVEHEKKTEAWIVPGWKQKGIAKDYEYPKAIRSADVLIQQSITEPTLTLLSDARLKVANSEMLQAQKALRAGEYDDAITLSASAFESLLKTICDIKNWYYDKDRDTCSTLIGICRKNALFPPFYSTSFESIGTIRNKLGDAHGRGPVRTNTAQLEHAEHMLNVTSASMLFLARLAGL
jgi:hypothetical protein